MILFSNKSKCRISKTRRLYEGKFEDELRKMNDDHPMKTWAETDAENGLTPEEGKRLRMQPGNAARATVKPASKKPYRLHTYVNWRDEFKPKGISYQEYLDIDLAEYYND
jgi:hypothetical protein